ncbi:MAG: pili assembly chaperone [Acidobacteria bacterium]|nr:pili assembly chaperone [Acidobacteriota bacterium]
MAKGFGGAIFFLVLAAVFMPNLLDGHGRRNEASAIRSLRTINTSEVTYASTYGKGFSPTLAVLGPPPAGDKPSAAHADLIDSVLAGGKKSRYNFVYAAGPPDKEGHIKSYSVVARPATPGVSGNRSFFTDETGVIRATMENRPASVSDPPI